MKQTAVEWYIDALKQWDLCYMESNGKISKDVYESTKISLQEKAKEIEKDYMSRSMLHGWRTALDSDVHSIDPNDFYNKLFQSE